jgi:dynactin complex subunit
MYVVKNITVDDKLYKSSKIVNYTTQKISVALALLEECARNFVKEEFGSKAFEQSKIIDIHRIDQVCEPIVDCMLLYRLNEDPHSVHVYQRRTEVVDLAGWFSTSKVPQSFFKKTHIFELEECTAMKTDNIDTCVQTILPKIEMVEFGPAKIKIPKPMTLAPICNLIDDLKKSSKFRARLACT